MLSTMNLLRCLALAGAAFVQTASASIGYTTYALIYEGGDNSATTAYSEPMSLSNALFLYIQIYPTGGDHADVIADFNTLAANYGAQGISVIPRVRYGTDENTIATEPDESILIPDVQLFAEVFTNITGTIDIPVIQAGFLGEWGEWHDGQYCEVQGTADSATDLAIKKEVVDTLLATGYKVALRYPEDHYALYNGSRTVTIHDDCIFDGGYTGYDGGTWPSDDYSYWVDYTISVAYNNTFGGEGCNNAGDSTFDWTDTSALCGTDGLPDFINYLGMAYMNWETPDPFEAMIEDGTDVSCEDAVYDALIAHV